MTFDHDPRINYFVKGAPTQNFGDYLPVLLARELMLQPRVEADIYRLIGSVIDSQWILRDLRHTVGAKSGRIAFWGCGMRDAQPLTPRARAQCSFFGVRGPLTRQALALPANTVMGDPGLLLPLLHRSSQPPVDTAQRTICIPHIHDAKSDDELLAISGADCVVRPSIAASETALRQVIDRIVHADFVLSGSLHGAIVACAYGRPFAFWDNGHLDVEFKWRDFAASVHIPCEFVRDVVQGRAHYAEAIAPRLRLPPLTPLLDICPFVVRPAMLLRALVHDAMLRGDDDIETAAAALDDLPSARLATVYALRDASARWRAERTRLADLAARHLGSAREMLKKAIRQRWETA